MAAFVADGHDYGSGTTGTNMVAKYDDQTCVCMWGETKITNFDELTDKWYKNMDEFMRSLKEDPTSEGKTADGELPFCVQFCSPAWLPKISLDKIQALRDYFCRINWEADDDKDRCTYRKASYPIPGIRAHPPIAFPSLPGRPPSPAPQLPSLQLPYSIHNPTYVRVRRVLARAL